MQSTCGVAYTYCLELQEPDSDDEAEELGMAARSILRSVPRHKLKELEALQADAEEENAATKVLALLFVCRT